MPWAFLVWLLCFCLQAALVGIAFYTLIQLYDFEEDLLNNFDCAKRCNRLVLVECAVQGSVLCLSVTSGHVIASFLNIAGAAVLGYRFYTGKQYLDSVELWKLLPQAKKWTYYKLAAFATAFAFTMFRTIELVVHELLSDHGRFMLRHVFQEALKDTMHL